MKQIQEREKVTTIGGMTATDAGDKPTISITEMTPESTTEQIDALETENAGEEATTDRLGSSTMTVGIIYDMSDRPPNRKKRTERI